MSTLKYNNHFKFNVTVPHIFTTTDINFIIQITMLYATKYRGIKPFAGRRTEHSNFK